MKISPLKARGPVFGLLLLFTIVIISFTSCQTKEETPDTGTTPPDTGTTPKVTWIADGIISPGEYARTNDYGNYQIHWSSDEQFIYVAMSARTQGWVAVGFKPFTGMLNADIVLGFVSDGETTIFDMFSPNYTGNHPPDTDQGGTYDILEFGGREEATTTTIEFKRALNTGDQYDKKLTKGTNNIIWSYGSTDSPTQQHFDMGTGELEL